MRNVFFIFIALLTLSCKKKAQTEVVPADTATVKNTTPATTAPTNPTPPVNTPTTPAVPRKYVTYLALGDSYTIGEAVEKENSFPFQLHTALLKSDTGKSLSQPLMVARTGWTTADLAQAIDIGGYKGQTYGVVTLLIGVNDQYQGYSVDDYRPNFIYLLNTAIQFAGGNKKRVFVISIPDYGVTPFANGRESEIGPQIDAFNAVNKEESEKAGVNYINITPISKQAATDKSLTASDGLHPSAKMYALWVKEIAPFVETEIN